MKCRTGAACRIGVRAGRGVMSTGRALSVPMTVAVLAASLTMVVKAVTVPSVGLPVVPAVTVVAMPAGMSLPVAVVMSVPVAPMMAAPVLSVVPVTVVTSVRMVGVVGVRQRRAGRRQPRVVALVRGRAEGNRETDNCDRHADQFCMGFDHLCLRVPIGQDQRYCRAVECGLN